MSQVGDYINFLDNIFTGSLITCNVFKETGIFYGKPYNIFAMTFFALPCSLYVLKQKTLSSLGNQNQS